jgi:large subunit ribosomal protein L6
MPVQGVSTGFTRELAIFGIGYRCEVKGRIAQFTLGYSHPIEFYLPDGIDMRVDKPANNLTPLILTGGDKQLLGQGGGQDARAAASGSLQEQGHSGM